MRTALATLCIGDHAVNWARYLEASFVTLENGQVEVDREAVADRLARTMPNFVGKPVPPGPRR